MELKYVLTIVVGVALFVMAIPTVYRMLVGPRLFPYTVSFLMRTIGRIYGFIWKFKLSSGIRDKTSPDLIDCLKNTKKADLTPFRDTFLALENLPTVVRGKSVLGLKSVFDVFAKKVSNKESEFTHPLQTPHFFIPGVPAKPFYEPTEFEFTARLEEAYPEIKKELEYVLEHEQLAFRSYVGGDGYVHDGWNNFFFYQFGKKLEENFALCPKTAEILDSIPHLEKNMAMFAALNPKSGLPPHTGPVNGILRVHLPLIVPENCRVKVADEERQWEEGKVMIFDDSFVHDVQNNSDSVRVVLFFSVPHPCFSEEEIPVLERLEDVWRTIPVIRLYENLQHREIRSNLVTDGAKS